MSNTNTAAKTEMITAIAAAVEPLRAAAIERAAQYAAEHAERVIAKYEADPACIEWKADEGKFERVARQSLIASLRAVCVVKTSGDWRARSSKFVRDADKLAQYIADAKEMASSQYTAFIRKLEAKVGVHTAATLEGSHVWGFSLLTITKADGSVEKWKTQTIVNVSCLGKPFNQWPSRKVKA